MRNLFFSKSFYSEFHWKNCTYYIGAVLPDYKDDLSQGMRELSQDSIRNRFLGGKKYLTEKELDYLTRIDGINHFALGIRNQEPKGVAICRMVRSEDDPLTAEVAITIIDEYQNKGLGTLLFSLIAYAAYERGISGLVIHLLPQNEGMQKIVRKFGRVTKKVSSADTLSYTISLEQNEMEELGKKIKELFSGK